MRTNRESRVPAAAEIGHRGGDDAVCFSAGLTGLVFGTGAIHAYLAADRKPPLVAAGIAFGALSAAAMQRCYKELESRDERRDSVAREARRWQWFRRYLKQVTMRPLSLLWRALPDKSDFFAGFPTRSDPATPDDLKTEEAAAAAKRDILANLGRWISRVPITVREVTHLVKAYVLFKEQGFLHFPLLLGHAYWTGERFALYVIFEPRFTLGSGAGWRVGRPLFGWLVYIVSATLVLSNLLLMISLISLGTVKVDLVPETLPVVWWVWTWSAVSIVALWLFGRRLRIVVAILFLFIALLLTDPQPPAVDKLSVLALAAFWAVLRLPWLLFPWGVRTPYNFMKRRILSSLEIENGIIDVFHLRRALFELFQDGLATDAPRPVVNDPGEPFPVVLVADALQPLRRKPEEDGVSAAGVENAIFYKQLFAREGTPLVEALTVTLRNVRIMGSSTIFEEDELKRWLDDATEPWRDDKSKPSEAPPQTDEM